MCVCNICSLWRAHIVAPCFLSRFFFLGYTKRQQAAATNWAQHAWITNTHTLNMVLERACFSADGFNRIRHEAQLKGRRKSCWIRCVLSHPSQCAADVGVCTQQSIGMEEKKGGISVGCFSFSFPLFCSRVDLKNIHSSCFVWTQKTHTYLQIRFCVHYISCLKTNY